MECCFTIGILDVNVPRNQRTKLFHFADVSLENLIVTQKGARGFRRLTVANGVKREPGYSAHEQSHNQRQNADDSGDNQDYFLRAHLRVEIQPGKIVDDRRIEQQAVESIQYTPMTRKNPGRILRARTALQSALSQVADHAYHVH